MSAVEPKRYITWQEYTKIRLKLELLDIEIEELEDELQDTEVDDPDSQYLEDKLAELTEKHSRLLQELNGAEVTGRPGSPVATAAAVAISVTVAVLLVVFLILVVLSS